jgi:hypothetical protein
MEKLIKILHIDPKWKVIYVLIRGGALIKTVVSIKTALSLMANHKFDLILSEPQNIAILDPQATLDENILKRLPLGPRTDHNPWKLASCAN